MDFKECSTLRRNKMAHSDHGNTVPSGQQKQRNAPAGHVVKVVDAVQYGLCTLGFFQMEFTSRRSSILAMTLRFSTRTTER